MKGANQGMFLAMSEGNITVSSKVRNHQLGNCELFTVNPREFILPENSLLV